MKHAPIVALAALALAGCQRSIDQQFEAMCAEQKSNPQAPRIGEEQCQSQETDPATRKLVVDMYNRQKARLEEAGK